MNIDQQNNALNTRAMLVYLSIGFWEGRKKDGSKTAEVTAAAHAEADTGNWWTRCISKADIKPVLQARDEARAVHLKMTLPWNDDGQRVLPATMFLKYTADMRKLEANYRAKVAEFVDRYPAIVATAPERLGKLFKADAFPPASQIADRFPWSLRFAPVPSAEDFRVDLGSDMTAEIRKTIEADSKQLMQSAMSDLWERLHDQVSKIAEKLSDPSGIFRDTLIENVWGLCDLLPKMNVTGDPNLEAMRKEVAAKLAGQDPDILRINKPARAAAAKSADEILKTMTAFMPQKAK